MFFIIGKYIENNRTVAVKIYDSETKEYGLYRKENVLQQVKTNNISVGGVIISGTGETYLSTNKGCYDTRKLDILDDTVNPINKKVRVVIAVKGFGKSTRITVVDSDDIEETIDYATCLAGIKKKEIVGAYTANSKYVIYSRWCKREALNMKDIITYKKVKTGT